MSARDEVACEGCPRMVDTRLETVYQRASGWVKKRSQGGAHALALPELETRFLCSGCMERLKRGIDPDQGVLLTYDEVQTLVGFLRSAFPRLTEDQLDLYAEMLTGENAQDASTAILEGISFWKYAPTWAEIKEAIKAVRARRPAAPEREDTVYARDSEMPPWVKRWLYARFVANPPDLRVFHEQQGVAPDVTPKEGWMPEDAWVEEAKTVTPQQVRQLMKAHMEIG